MFSLLLYSVAFHLFFCKNHRKMVKTTVRKYSRRYNWILGTQDAISIMIYAMEKIIREDETLHVRFIDMEKAFDRINITNIYEI